IIVSQSVDGEGKVGPHRFSVRPCARAAYLDTYAIVRETGRDCVMLRALYGLEHKVAEGGEGNELARSEKVAVPFHAVGLDAKPKSSGGEGRVGRVFGRGRLSCFFLFRRWRDVDTSAVSFANYCQ